MTLVEILPEIRRLPMDEKLHLFRILAEELDTSEDIYPLEHHKTYYLMTPYESYSAGKILAEALT
ncbi:MAG: hypothetical protein DWI57_17195, partial [Chloroflexi bacterium]